MADIIATEYQAWLIGLTGGTAPSTTLCVTKARALALNCNVSGTYAANLLVCLKDLSSATRTVVDTIEEYQNISIGQSYAPDIAASGSTGNGVRAYATVTFQKRTKIIYNYGDPTYTSWQNDSETIYGEYVTADSKGSSLSNKSNVGTSTPSGYVAGAMRTGSALTIYQEANYVVSITATNTTDSLSHFVYNGTISASGGSLAITGKGIGIYTFSSGEKVSTGSLNPSFGGTSIFSRSNFTITNNALAPNGNNIFSINATNGTVTALNRSTINGSAYNCTVEGKLVITYNHPNAYNGGHILSLVLTLSTICLQSGVSGQIEVFISGASAIRIGSGHSYTYTAFLTNGSDTNNVTLTFTSGSQYVTYKYEDVGEYAITLSPKAKGTFVLLARSNQDLSKTVTKVVQIT